MRRLAGTLPLSIAAIALALGFRLWIVSAFPYDGAGDTPLYDALAKGLVTHGSYSLEVDGRQLPVNVRMPGYPALLAAVHAVAGPDFGPVRVAQAVLDTLTCLLTALLAARLAAPERRRRAWLAGLWLAALCPFTANYASAILAEVPGGFWNTAAVLLAVVGLQRLQADARLDRRGLAALAAAGVAAGAGCYFRPETPLVLLAVGLTAVGLW